MKLGSSSHYRRRINNSILADLRARARRFLLSDTVGFIKISSEPTNDIYNNIECHSSGINPGAAALQPSNGRPLRYYRIIAARLLIETYRQLVDFITQLGVIIDPFFVGVLRKVLNATPSL